MIFTYLPFTYNPQTLILIPTVFLLELIEFSKYTIVYQKISFFPFFSMIIINIIIIIINSLIVYCIPLS